MTSIGLVACIRIQGVVTTHPHHSIDMTPLARRYILRAASYICICIQPYKHSPRCTRHTHLYAPICYFYLCIRITICSVHTCTPRATYCSHKHHTSKRDLLIWQKRPAYCTQTHHTRCSIRHALFFCFLLRTHTVYNSSIHLFTTHTFYYTYLLLHVPYTIAPCTSPACCVHVPYTICFKHRTFPFCIHIRHTTPYIP